MPYMDNVCQPTDHGEVPWGDLCEGSVRRYDADVKMTLQGEVPWGDLCEDSVRRCDDTARRGSLGGPW